MFISPDTVVQDSINPQTLNRYSYCINNPLKYMDPTVHFGVIGEDDLGNLIQVSPTGKVSPNATRPPPFVDKSVTITAVKNPFTVTFSVTDDPLSVHEPGFLNNPGLLLGYGTTTIRGTATYTDGGVTVDLTVLSKNNNMPPTIQVEYQAEVQVESQNVELKLDPPASSLLPYNASVFSGSRNFGGVSLGTRLSLEIVPSAVDKDASKIKSLPNKAVVPWAWVVDLRTGTVSRYNWYIH
jgi:hypothetical protein